MDKVKEAMMVDTSIFISDAIESHFSHNSCRKVLDILRKERNGFTTDSVAEKVRKMLIERGVSTKRFEEVVADIKIINHKKIPQYTYMQAASSFQKLVSFFQNEKPTTPTAYGYGRYTGIGRYIRKQQKAMYRHSTFLLGKFDWNPPDLEDIEVLACAIYLKKMYDPVYMVSIDTHFVPVKSQGIAYAIVPDTIYKQCRVICRRPSELLNRNFADLRSTL